MTPEMIAILAVGASLAGVIATLGGLIWQSHRALRADLSAGLREAKEDRDGLHAELYAGLREAREGRETLRAELGGRTTGIAEQQRLQGEHLSCIEGMLHWH